MRATVFFGDRQPATVDACPDGGRLWLSPPDLERASGWTLKPEGLCREDACVPLPRDGSWLDDDGRIDLAAFAARLRRPLVHDADRSVWAFGDPAEGSAGAAASAHAPDFILPDLDGEPRALSDFRGTKVFLLAWGSY